MKIVSKVIKLKSRSDSVQVVPIGDIHKGNIGFYEKGLLADIEYVKNTKNCYWIGMGDYCDCILPNDFKRFDPKSIEKCYRNNLSDIVQNQRDDIIRYFTPIKDRCLGVLTGNHEESIRKYHYMDISLDLARKLSAPYLGYSGFIKLKFLCGSIRRVVLIYAHHGYGASRKSGGKVNRLEDMVSFIDADIVILAHEHKKVWCPPVVKIGVDNGNRLVERVQYACMSGSYLRGYVDNSTTYVEKAAYKPSDLGTIKIHIKPDVKKIKGEM